MWLRSICINIGACLCNCLCLYWYMQIYCWYFCMRPSFPFTAIGSNLIVAAPSDTWHGCLILPERKGLNISIKCVENQLWNYMVFFWTRHSYFQVQSPESWVKCVSGGCMCCLCLQTTNCLRGDMCVHLWQVNRISYGVCLTTLVCACFPRRNLPLPFVPSLPDLLDNTSATIFAEQTFARVQII